MDLPYLRATVVHLWTFASMLSVFVLAIIVLVIIVLAIIVLAIIVLAIIVRAIIVLGVLQSAGGNCDWLCGLKIASAENLHSVAAWAFVESRPYRYIPGHTGITWIPQWP